MKIKINGQFFSFFDNISISQKLDSIASTFSFDARFNHANLFHKEIFKPLSYNKVEIFNNDDKLFFTGVSINTSLSSNSSRQLQNISGYSSAGVLEDCSIPVSAYPLEKLNVSLEDVIKPLLREFQLNYNIDASVVIDMSLNYPKVVAKADETVKEFIAKLSSQRNIILSHNEKGDLLFFKPNKNAKAKELFDTNNTTSMELLISGQSMHSKISVIRQPSKNNPGLSAVDTIDNNLIKVKRTIVKTLSSGSETDTKKAADNILADELKSISINISINRYVDVKCGDIVEVLNPEIYLYEKTRLIVSELTINENSDGEKMNLRLSLPETFTGEQPKNIFI